MFITFQHNDKEVCLDLEKPVRVKLKDWADYEGRVWIYASVDLNFWLEGGEIEWQALTLTRENEKGEQAPENSFELGDAISSLDVEEVYSNHSFEVWITSV